MECPSHRRRLLLLVLAFTLMPPCAAYNNGLGALPPMGWNSWCTDSLCNAFGKDPCSEEMVTSVADSIVAQGLDKLGYKFVSLDDCWSSTSRNATGHLQADAKAFPRGMKYLADYVHDRNLLLGVYTDVGATTCKGGRPGSYGNYEKDAATLASWGIDLVKMDHCTAPKNTSDRDLYGNMSAALNATGRPILFSLCSWGGQEVWEWGSEVAQMFRIAQDHFPLWTLPKTNDEQGGYGSGVKDIIEWMAHLVPSKWTRRYGWLDPDFLMTLYPVTMGAANSRTEFSFWSLWSAPLLVSTDIRNMSQAMRDLIANEEVIAIDQDQSCTAGDRVWRDNATDTQLWARPLANGDKAVILFNEGRFRSRTVSVAWSQIGWPANASVAVRDLWAKKDLGAHPATFNGMVRPHDVLFLRLRKLG